MPVSDTTTESFWYQGSPTPPNGRLKLATTNQSYWYRGTPIPPIALTVQTTDSGTATDASTLHATYPGTDSAVGSDASTLAIFNFFFPTDSASGSDSSTLVALLSRTDAVSGADASTLQAAYGKTDAGSGADASTEQANQSLTDAASGADAISDRAYIEPDTGTATDSSTVVTGDRSWFLTDAAVAADVATLHAKANPTDSANGQDTSTPNVTPFTRTDSAVGTDFIGHKASFVRDAGVGTNVAALRVRHPRTDSAVGTDLTPGIQVYVKARDHGKLADFIIGLRVHDYVDSYTVYGVAVITAGDAAHFVDAGYVIGAGHPSAVEDYIAATRQVFHDTGLVIGAGHPSAIENAE